MCGGSCGWGDDGGKVQQRFREGDNVSELRDGEGGDAQQGLLHLRVGDQGRRPRLLVLHYTADPRRRGAGEEPGYSGVQIASAPFRL